MSVIFDGQHYSNNNIPFDTNNRAFRYGDGLFETMIFKNGTVKWVDRHLSRLLKGMSLLGFEFEQKLLENQFHLAVSDLKLPSIQAHKLRFRVWRRGAGVYAPQQNGYHYLLESEPLHNYNPIQFIDKVGISAYQLVYSPISECKTMNALPYVYAALEAQQNGWHDTLICSVNGNIAELTSSNLFFCNDDTLVTPAILSGCIRGVIRSEILDKCPELGIQVQEVNAPLSYFSSFKGCFAVNVSAVRHVASIDGFTFDTNFSSKWVSTYLADVWH